MSFVYFCVDLVDDHLDVEVLCALLYGVTLACKDDGRYWGAQSVLIISESK